MKKKIEKKTIKNNNNNNDTTQRIEIEKKTKQKQIINGSESKPGLSPLCRDKDFTRFERRWNMHRKRRRRNRNKDNLEIISKREDRKCVPCVAAVTAYNGAHPIDCA